MHETGHNSAFVSPDDEHYPAVCIGLFCDDPDNYFDQAVTQGAIVLQPMKSHSYGYRQGMIRDPFGHIWQIQKRL